MISLLNIHLRCRLVSRIVYIDASLECGGLTPLYNSKDGLKFRIESAVKPGHSKIG